MSAWIEDEDGFAHEEIKWIPGGETCRNCGEYKGPRQMAEDGWCRSCAGETPTAEDVRLEAMRATLVNARKLVALKRARRDPEHEIRWWEERVSALTAELGGSEAAA